MTQQSINLGAAPNDKTGDTLRSGGLKIEANFTELYGRVAALETSTGTSSGQISALQAADVAINSAIAAEAATRLAQDNTLITNLATEVAARLSGDTTLTNSLAAEAAARAAADQQPFTDTTNGMTFAVGTSYNMIATHNCIFPVMTDGQWVRLQPANGNWYSLTGTLDPGTMVLSPVTMVGIEPDAVLLFIYHAGTNQLRMRQ